MPHSCVQTSRMIECAESCGNRIERILADLLGKKTLPLFLMFPSLALESLPGQSSVEVSGSLPLISIENKFWFFYCKSPFKRILLISNDSFRSRPGEQFEKALFLFSTAWNLLFKNSYYELAQEIQLRSFLFFPKPSLSLSLPSSFS